MGSSLAVVGVAFRFISPEGQATGPTTAGIATVAALVVFIASLAFSLGPVTWTVINEVFPARVRGRGAAIATAINWGSAYCKPILPVARRGDRQFDDLLAVRLVLCHRLGLDLLRSSGDQSAVA
jgi:hypothetical protein